jgi:hypothetical protein
MKPLKIIPVTLILSEGSVRNAFAAKGVDQRRNVFGHRLPPQVMDLKYLLMLHENVHWLRGHHELNSVEVQAALAAQALLR